MAISDLIERLNKPAGLDLFRMIALKRFVRLDTLVTLVTPPSPIYILYKLCDPIRQMPIDLEDEETMNLPIGKLHHLTSASLVCGYLLELPQHSIQIGTNFLTVARRVGITYDDVKVCLSNEHLDVFASHSDAMLVVSDKSYWISRENFFGKRVT